MQSNGNLSISLRNSSGSDEKVLDLSEYETYLNELKQQLDPEGYAAEQEAESENADDSEDYPYAMQVLQGTNYKHDYIMTQADSSDTTNKTISTTPDSSLSSTSAAGTTVISAAYAAQIQAVSDEGAANMLAAGYNNISSVTGDSSSSASKLFSTILNNS